MKIRLITTGGYEGMKGVKLPVEVDAVIVAGEHALANVDMNNMKSIGYDRDAGLSVDYAIGEQEFPFYIGIECEVVG